MASEASGALALEGETIRDFDRMYRENVVYVLKTLRRFGLPRQACEDLAQDVFEAMFLKVLSLTREERRSLPIARAYLFGIAWKLFLNYQRHSSVTRETPFHDMHDVPIESVAHNHVLAREMARFLDHLSAHEVAIFVGFEVFGMTIPEMARDVGMPDRDVWRTLADVRGRLRRTSHTPEEE